MRRIWLVVAAMHLSIVSPTLAQQDYGWSRYSDPAIGYAVDLPLDLFALVPDTPPEAPVFLEIGGEGQINLYNGIAHGLTLADFAQRFAQDDPSREVTYQAEGQSWFVLSGLYRAPEAGAAPLIFYTKVLLSADRERFSGFEISYPASEKQRFDAIVERLNDTFRRPQ